ncbi:MAG: hypothetical protein JWN40_5001 [Phycisphaerales bacterium]|nr:hypothetical protein [Phycisphaerales bacterium]
MTSLHRATARLTILTALLLLVGCDHPPASGLATVPVQIGSKTFTLEIADRTDSRTFGLMRRDSMPADHGMLFVFDAEEPRGFWMKNCRIPLDIIYLDAAGKVVSVKQMKPYDLNSTPSDGPAQYAIELNKGAASSAGVTPGMSLKLPAGLTSKD